jgi:hypothetical protein
VAARGFPLPDTIAATCAHTLISGWIACFGVQDQIKSDRGPQFTSEVWQDVCKLLGVKHMHRRLKEALHACGESTWLQDLPWVLLGLRATPTVNTGRAPVELVFGAHCSTRPIFRS